MYAFSVPRSVVTVSRHAHRRLPAAMAQDAAGGLDPSCVFLAIHDEDALARKALEAEPREDDAGLRVYREEELARWPAWPMRLGRRDLHGSVIEDPTPLPAQIAALRARHPARRHFRIAIVGGFGFNLGDTVLGATAWRTVWPMLTAALPSVGVDVLLGPFAHPAIAGLIGHEDGIAQVLFQAPSLQTFAHYDAFFDFSGLIKLPRFHDMPALDWILWWLGLDPEAVPAAAKRNRLHLPAAALTWAQERLAAVARPRIAFVWRASTPLRSMPDDVALAFAAELLAVAPQVNLVTDHPLPLDHPRHVALGKEADSPARMMALIAQADGLIGVDSLAPHVADASDVPTVMLLASLPRSRFPYYPHMSIVTPPMEVLPGWGITKVPDEKWPEMREAYAACWANVSARECSALLQQRMAVRPAAARRRRPDVEPARDPASNALAPVGVPFPHDRPTDLARWIDTEILRFAQGMLVPGHTVVLASADSGDLAPALARAVSPTGALHVLDPRRLRAQKLVADVHAKGLASLHLRPAMAGASSGVCRIADFDPAGEADPDGWGNCARTIEVAVSAIDDLHLPDCRLLVLRPPQDVTTALRGAGGLLATARPLIVAGPVATAALADLEACLALHDYRGWVSRPAISHPDILLCLASPRETTTAFDGFAPLSRVVEVTS